MYSVLQFSHFGFDKYYVSGGLKRVGRVCRPDNEIKLGLGSEGGQENQESN